MIIESPVHSVHLSDLTPVDVAQVLLAYKKRILQLTGDGSIKYVQVFLLSIMLVWEIEKIFHVVSSALCHLHFVDHVECIRILNCYLSVGFDFFILWLEKVFKNHGASAGASMTHSHSQMVGLPVIPPSVSTRLDSMKEYFNQTGKCSICHVPTKDLLVDESVHFISVVPYAASFPFELWIVPRDHVSHFHELDQDKVNQMLNYKFGLDELSYVGLFRRCTLKSL